MKYIDTYNNFVNEDGLYDNYGSDLTGKIRRLRTKDGIYFTSAGYGKLAHFAKRLIAADIRKAVAEREIPLAGSEIEQNRINPKSKTPSTSQQETKPDIIQLRRFTSQRLSSNATSAPSPLRTISGLKDQKADNSKVTLRTLKDGVARSDTIEILRPAISAPLLALLNRGQLANKKKRLQRNIPLELSNGVVLMNSVTSISQSVGRRGRTQISLSQTPFFRVWAKGERLTPKLGRADDIEWPRPEPEPVMRATITSPSAGSTGKQHSTRTVRKYTPEGFPPLPRPNPRAR